MVIRGWPKGCLLLVIAVMTGACSQRQHAAQDAPSSREERDAGAEDASSEADGSADAHLDGDGEHVDASGASGSDPQGDAGSAGRAEPPEGEVIARGAIGDAGAEVRVEAIDGGVGFRIVAAEETPLAIEPLSRLDGPMKIGAYFGPRCPTAAQGQARFLGLWRGEVSRCVTEPQPMALLHGRAAVEGCPIEQAPRGSYELSLYPCGHYAEPLVTVGFEMSTDLSTNTQDSGPVDESGESNDAGLDDGSTDAG